MLAVLDAKSSAVEAQSRRTPPTCRSATRASTRSSPSTSSTSSREWRRAVDEAVRVLRPGGRIVLSTFVVLDDPTTVLRQRMFQEAGTGPRRVGVEITDVMADLKGRFGATTAELAAIPHVMTTSLAAELDGLRAGTLVALLGVARRPPAPRGRQHRRRASRQRCTPDRAA